MTWCWNISLILTRSSLFVSSPNCPLSSSLLAPWWEWIFLRRLLVSWWRRSSTTSPWLWRSPRGPSWPSLEGEISSFQLFIKSTCHPRPGDSAPPPPNPRPTSGQVNKPAYSLVVIFLSMWLFRYHHTSPSLKPPPGDHPGIETLISLCNLRFHGHCSVVSCSQHAGTRANTHCQHVR